MPIVQNQHFHCLNPQVHYAYPHSLICANHKNHYGMKHAICAYFTTSLEFLPCTTKLTQIPHKHFENHYIMKHVGYNQYKGIVPISLSMQKILAWPINLTQLLTRTLKIISLKDMWSTCHCAHLEVLALIHHKHLENHYKKKHVNASHCAHFIGHLIILACPNFSLAPNQDKGLHPTSSIRNNTLGLSLTSHLNLRHLTYLN